MNPQQLARGMQEMIEWANGQGLAMFDGLFAVAQPGPTGPVYSIIGFESRSTEDLLQKFEQIQLQSAVCLPL